MSRFQERLWGELVSEHATTLAHPARTRYPLRRLSIVEPPPLPLRWQPSTRGWLVRRRGKLAAGVVALAAALAATVSILATTGTAPSVAYAVTRSPDGTITITIGELKGVYGADAQLTKLGVPIRVLPELADCSSTGRTVLIPPELAGKLAHGVRGGIAVQPGLIPAGDTLVIGARQIGWFVGMGYALYQGVLPTCIRAGTAHAG
jgi:hypothetical protein